MTKHYQLVGIGNAIVDVLSYVDDAFIAEQHLTKGRMMLVDEAEANVIYNKIGTATECSGGSVANTLAGFSMLGGQSAFIGKVYDDQLGRIFRHDMQSIGVDFDTPSATTGKSTAICIVCVTPDAERTMNTYLGACNQLTEDDIDPELIANAEYLHIEGYLWDEPHAIAALKKAADIAKQSGTKVAFSVSDVFCIEGHREDFFNFIDSHVDWLFANEQEIIALTQRQTFDDAAAMIRNHVHAAALTRGAEGSVLFRGDENATVEPHCTDEVIDTTGAGDLYVSGVLYGQVNGWGLQASGKLGSMCAGHIITQLGARSQQPLSPFLEQADAA